MTPELLLNRLMASSAAQRLGHFYIFQGRGNEAQPQLDWSKHFIRRYWLEVEKRTTLPQDVFNDMDLLRLRPWDDEENGPRDEYTVGDLAGLTTFLSFHGIKSRRRFVILEDMHKLTPEVANRMLKMLEEPEGQVTYLGFNPSGKKLLPTIESRAIVLALSWQRPEKPVILTDLKTKFASAYGLHQFVEDTKKNFSLTELFNELLSYEQNHDGPAALKQELLKLYQSHLEAQLYNQTSSPQIHGLYLYLGARFRTER